MQETQEIRSGRSPGLRNGNILQYSCLENSMDRGDLQATINGVAKSWTRLSARVHTHTHTHTHTVQSSHSVGSESFATPWTAAFQASLSITNSQSLLKLMSLELVMPSNHLNLCHPILLLPSIFPSIRVFSNESVLPIR